MKFLITLVFLSLITFFTQAQENISLSINTSKDYTDGFIQIAKYQDDYIVLSRSSYCLVNEINEECGLLSRINKQGDILWSLELPTSTGSAYLAVNKGMILQDDKIVFVLVNVDSTNGPYISMYSVNYDGILLKSKEFLYPVEQRHVTNIVFLKNHYYIAVSKKYAEREIWKLDTMFNKVYVKELPFTEEVRAMDLEVLDDNTIAFSFAKRENGAPLYGNIYIYNDELELLKSIKTVNWLQDPLLRIRTLQTADGGYLLAYAKNNFESVDDDFYPPTLYKYDSLFNLEWEYVFLDPSDKEIGNLRKVGDYLFLGMGGANSLYISGQDNYPEISEGWVFLINDQGELQWERHIFDKRYTIGNLFNDGLSTDLGYTLVGQLDSLKDTPSPFLDDPSSWILTLDKDGCWNGNCNKYILIENDSTSSTIVKTTQVNEKEDLNIYPNPSNGIFTIEFDDLGRHSVIIHNMTGQKIFEKELLAKKSIINLNGLPTGLYLINVYNDEGGLIKQEKIIIH